MNFFKFHFLAFAFQILLIENNGSLATSAKFNYINEKPYRTELDLGKRNDAFFKIDSY
jgi:hypothetical protein